MGKKVLWCLFCFVCCNVHAQIPKDIPAIETIIAGHKSIWKRLNDRKNNEYLNYSLASRVRNIADEYNEVRQDLSKRIEYSYNMVVFAKDVVDISTLLTQNAKVIGEYVSFVSSNLNKTPDLYQYFMRYYDGIEEEIKTVKNLVTASLVLRSNYEERFLTIRNIKNSLSNIKWMVERILWLSKGVVAMGGTGRNWMEILQSEDIKNYGKKLATEVINSYSK